MPDEQVTTGSAGPARRLPPRRRGRAAAAEEAAAQVDLDERERNISPRRRAMGPAVTPESEPRAPAPDQPPLPEEPPTDPRRGDGDGGS
jgi:hypothetical protein